MTQSDCISKCCQVEDRISGITRRGALGLVAGALTVGSLQAKPYDDALERLLAGNKRYRESRLAHPDQNEARRMMVSHSQQPFAVILSCSDSRVPPEIVFDEGLGDLFVIRNAGHVVDKAVLGSIEYAVGHLKVPLVLVLGHSECGAVKAAVDQLREAHLANIVEAISPAVKQARKSPGDLWQNSVRENVRVAVHALASSKPVLSERVSAGTIRVAGAQYDLASGGIELIR